MSWRTKCISTFSWATVFLLFLAMGASGLTIHVVSEPVSTQEDQPLQKLDRVKGTPHLRTGL